MSKIQYLFSVAASFNSYYMQRSQALTILRQNLFNENLIKHCLAVEAIMRALALRFDEDAEKWGLTGLLHDIDYDKVRDNMEQHSLLGAEMLKDLGFDVEICEAVKSHNEAHGIEPNSLLAKALYVADPMSGLIIASTLVLPDRKIENLTAENILNRFKEKRFAAGANRKIIARCEEMLGLSLEEFADIALKAMQGINKELGL